MGVKELRTYIRRQMDDVHFSSKKQDWATPQPLFALLNDEFHFTLDAAASHENAKCRRYFTEIDDGLKQDWIGERVFLNPPYGAAVSRWLKKAYDEYRSGALVVCIVAARPDTSWWFEFCNRSTEIRLLYRRVKFVGPGNSPAFPTAAVIFDRDSEICMNPPYIWCWDWKRAIEAKERGAGRQLTLAS
jgi:site-specific DNA-methyltransferase (adenine-specific)